MVEKEEVKRIFRPDRGNVFVCLRFEQKDRRRRKENRKTLPLSTLDCRTHVYAFNVHTPQRKSQSACATPSSVDVWGTRMRRSTESKETALVGRLQNRQEQHQRERENKKETQRESERERDSRERNRKNRGSNSTLVLG